MMQKHYEVKHQYLWEDDFFFHFKLFNEYVMYGYL